MLNKKVIALVATAALAGCLALAGCGSSQSASSSAATSSDTSASASADASASTSAAASESASASSDTASASSASAATSASSASATTEYIGNDAAKRIALEHAGIAESDAAELEVELDLDDAVVHYDVDFKSGGMEYNYDINAVTGDIIQSKSETDD